MSRVRMERRMLRRALNAAYHLTGLQLMLWEEIHMTLGDLRRKL